MPAPAQTVLSSWRATTSRYLDHIRPQQLIDEMQQREPWDPDAK